MLILFNRCAFSSSYSIQTSLRNLTICLFHSSQVVFVSPPSHPSSSRSMKFLNEIYRWMLDRYDCTFICHYFCTSIAFLINFDISVSIFFLLSATFILAIIVSLACLCSKRSLLLASSSALISAILSFA